MDGGDEGSSSEINAAGQTALHGYGRFVGDRFKDLPNIVWMLGGDYAFRRRCAGWAISLPPACARVAPGR
jgi:hypothetical protein